MRSYFSISAALCLGFVLTGCKQQQVKDNGIGDPDRGFSLPEKAMVGPFPYVIQAGGPIDRSALTPTESQRQQFTDRLVKPKFRTEELVELKSKPNEAESQAFSDLMLQARKALDAKRYAEATAIARAAETINRQDPQAPLLVAKCLAGQGDADASIASLKRYVELSGAPLAQAIELSGFLNIRTSPQWKALEIEAKAREDFARKVPPPTEGE